jgi:hypothetical protein
MQSVIGVLVGLAAGLLSPRLLRFFFGRRRKLLGEALQDYFGEDPRQLPIVGRTFTSVDLPNLHLAISQHGKRRVIGYTSAMGRLHNSLRVTDAHCETALRELCLGGGELTRSLLGFAPEEEN